MIKRFLKDKRGELSLGAFVTIGILLTVVGGVGVGGIYCLAQPEKLGELIAVAETDVPEELKIRTNDVNQMAEELKKENEVYSETGEVINYYTETKEKIINGEITMYSDLDASKLSNEEFRELTSLVETAKSTSSTISTEETPLGEGQWSGPLGEEGSGMFYKQTLKHIEVADSQGVVRLIAEFSFNGDTYMCSGKTIDYEVESPFSVIMTKSDSGCSIGTNSGLIGAVYIEAINKGCDNLVNYSNEGQ